MPDEGLAPSPWSQSWSHSSTFIDVHILIRQPHHRRSRHGRPVKIGAIARNPNEGQPELSRILTKRVATELPPARSSESVARFGLYQPVHVRVYADSWASARVGRSGAGPERSCRDQKYSGTSVASARRIRSRTGVSASGTSNARPVTRSNRPTYLLLNSINVSTGMSGIGSR
jgi:hypothetical protein